MKHLSILALVFATSYSFAQDTLYTVSGQKISAKVVEINQTEIKYKKSNNPDGPVYVVDKNDVALIEYKNGSKELYGTGSGSNEGLNTNDQNVAGNDIQPKPRVNVIIGGGWGWPVFNSWGWWGGYRVYPRVRYHHHHYKPFRNHHFHYGRRGR
jgi:hypothetical protein